MDYALTVFDTSGIQSYIFASNRLRHNVAASFLVEKAMSDWLDDAVKEVCGAKTQLTADPASAVRRIENPADDLLAEVIYRGGGNAVLLFKSDGQKEAIKLGKAVARSLTCRVMLEAPGLRIAAAHQAFDWKNEVLSDIYDETLRQLARNKSQAAPPPALLGQSVTALCSYTSLPAVQSEIDAGRTRYISAETQAKMAHRDDARAKLKADFAGQIGQIAFEDDFGEFGEEHEHGYMAVVHADGNGMGSRKTELCKRFSRPEHNREFVTALRAFSDQINAAGREAFRAVVGGAVQRCSKIGIPGNADDAVRILFTPVVYGGDDVTFVCDGLQGLWLAASFLKQFAEECNRRELLKGAQACAGVAVVNTHFPFARAYGMAADLCHNAKQRAREREGAYIDWHFAVNGAIRSVSQIRRREYTTSDKKSLTLRPISLNPPQPELRSWDVLSRLTGEFAHGKDWRDRRNKVKEMREVLREGPDACRQFRSLYDLPALPEALALPSDYKDTGWHGDQCVYFDAIEAMDHFDGGQLL